MNGKSILIFAFCLVLSLTIGSIIFRWLIPWWVDRSAKKSLREIKEGKTQKPRSFNFEIAFSSTEISVLSLRGQSKESISVAWSKINRATAFKRDLYTVDCICLLFETVDKMTLELDEDMKGWPEFTEAMSNYLPGCKPLSEWIFQVATPAFETNPTELFARS